jgi:uncharacterized membrane protein
MADRLSFRWSYIIAPAIVFLLSVVLFACFYHLLPAGVAVHFDMGGNPDNWLGPEMTVITLLAPQLLFFLMALGIAWGVIRLDRRFSRAENGGVGTGRMVSFMGNIMALPQLIILFAMLDILSYNAYQTHILPMWLFLIIVLGLMTAGLLVAGVVFFLKVRKAMRGENPP